MDVEPSNGRLAARHLIENDAERKDVRPVIHRPARDLLGRHVGGRAQHDADLGASAAGQRDIRWVGRPELFCQAEVEHFHTTIVRHHDVARLEIAVHDAFVMRRCKRIRQRRADRERPIDGQAIMWNELGQRLPVDELHCQKVNAVDLVDGVDRDDVRMIQRRYGARLALESRQAIGVASHLGREHLQRDGAAECGVGRAKHLAHSASAQLGEDLVATYRRANHRQILASATARLAEARREGTIAGGGGPPAPMAPVMW